MKLLPSAILLASVCGGCVDPLVQQQANYAAQEEARANYLMRLKSRCSAYGYAPGTSEFSSCMMQVDANTQAANHADEQQRRAAILGVLMNQPAAVMPQATFTPLPTRQTINTNCETLQSGYVSCTSR